MDTIIKFQIQNPEVALTGLKVLGAQQFLNATHATQLYKIEVVTSQGTYYIHRTFAELREAHAVLKDCYPKAKFAKFPKTFTHLVKGSKLEKRIKKITACLTSYVKHAANAAPLRDKLTPRAEQFQLLHVSVMQGRNLAARDSNGKSDPFVRIAVVDGENRVTSKGARTATIKGTLNPTWTEEDYLFDLSDPVSAVTFSVWDWDRASRNDFLGRVTLRKEDIPHNKEVLRWFPLYRTKARQGDIVHGELLLRLQHITAKPGGICLEPKVNEFEDKEYIAQCKAERQERHERKIKERPAGKIHLNLLYNPPLGNWDGYITITVIEAVDLPALDRGGTSDPYAVLSLNGKRFRTKILKKTTRPTWKETFYFYVPHDQIHGLRLELDVYDWDAVSKRDFIGDLALQVEEMAEGLTDKWVPLVGPAPTQKGLQKKLGKAMAEEGWAPKLPIVLVPGFGSTGLEVIEGYEKWRGERVWLSISKIGGQALSVRRQIQQFQASRKMGRSTSLSSSMQQQQQQQEKRQQEEETDQLTADDVAFKNRWIAHISLGPDGYSDPENIKVRPVKGVEAVTYLDPGALTSPLSWVMGPLVSNLQQLGYAYGKNLLAAGYDWRLPPHQLEERDRYFSNLKASIQEMGREYGPVVLVGHSMGNRTIQYFLNWIMRTDNRGRKWIDDHIHTFMAVGAPFLGASKAIRGLVTGEKFGLDAFLNDTEAITFSRRIASTTFLLPVGLESKHHHMPADFPSFTAFQDEHEDAPKPVPYLDFLVRDADAASTMHMREEYLMKSPLFGGHVGDEYILKAPPVRRLYAIYGINLDTEVGCVFKREKNGRIVLEDPPAALQKALHNEGYAVRKGIVYETSKSRQGIIREMTGEDGFTCGDGTVSYASLNHCTRWKDDIPQLTIDELDGAEHREILTNRLFFKKLFEYVAEKVTVANMADLGDLATRLGISAENFLAEIADDVDTPVENA